MDLSGIYAAISTPFSKDEQIAFDILELNLNLWLAQPMAGIVVLGTVGEAVYHVKNSKGI